MKQTTKPFGDELTRLLADRETSQRQLALRLGISNTSIHLLANGDMEPTHEMIETIASELNIGPEHFAEYRLEKVRRELDWRHGNLRQALKNARDRGLG